MSSLPVPPPASTRRRLPDTRPSITVKRTICGSEYYITVGFYDDPSDGPRDTPAELFIKCPHHGSVTAGLIDGLCTAMSVAWQYGVPWEVNRNKFLGTRFGHADFHDGVEQTSFLDGLAKAIDGIVEERRKVTGEDCPSVDVDWLKPEKFTDFKAGDLLATRDGRKIGNAQILEAIKTFPLGKVYRIKTDYGNPARLTPSEVNEFFYPEPLRPCDRDTRDCENNVKSLSK